MVDKFEIYELVGILVPGVLVVAAIPLGFPSAVAPATSVQFSDGFGLLTLTALSVFVGYLIQTLASLIEPLLNWTWRGRPSDVAFAQGLGDRYFPLDSAQRIRRKLITATAPDATDRSLFLYAMQVAESCGSARVRHFNALYAFHRGLIVVVLMALIFFSASFCGGYAESLTRKQSIVLLAILIALLLLFWHRTKQRGCYYAREVLLCAERQISEKGT